MHKQTAFCGPSCIKLTTVNFAQRCAAAFPVTKFAGNFALNGNRIHRPYHHYARAIRRVPFFVQRFQPFGWSRFQHLLFADRKARCIKTARVKQLPLGLAALRLIIVPLPLLGDDDTAFAIHCCRIECDFTGGFAHQKQRPFDQRRISLWQV